MRRVFRIGVLVSALLIGMAGCSATKEWFRDKTDWVRSKWGGHEDAGVSAKANGNASARVSADSVHVMFSSDRWELDKVAQTDLVRLTKRLRDNPKLRVRLEGYAESVGSHDYNLQLKRVDAVRRFLVEKGVEPTRFRSVSLGELADHGRQAKNHRVTVKLVGASE